MSSSEAAELSKFLEGRVDLVQHIGRYVEARHFDRCYSALMVADQLFRGCPHNRIVDKHKESFLEQLRLPAPMSYVFDNETQNFDPGGILPRAYLKNSYKDFSQQMRSVGGEATTCDNYTTFKKKTYTGRMVMRHIARVMRDRCGKVSVSKVHEAVLKAIPFFRIYLRENIRSQDSIEKNITRRDVIMILTNRITAPEFWTQKYLQLHQSLLSETDVILLQSIGAGGGRSEMGFDQISEDSESSSDELPGCSSSNGGCHDDDVDDNGNLSMSSRNSDDSSDKSDPCLDPSSDSASDSASDSEDQKPSKKPRILCPDPAMAKDNPHTKEDDITVMEDEWYLDPTCSSITRDNLPNTIVTCEQPFTNPAIQAFTSEISNPPVIVIETFSATSTGEIVAGPSGSPMQPDYLLDAHKRLRDIVSCSTNNEYFYCFTYANLRPHFVLGDNQYTDYISNVMSRVSTAPTYYLHGKQSTKQPVRLDVNGTSFHFYGNRTKEYQDSFTNKTPIDITFWMKRFDHTRYKMDKDAAARGLVDSCDVGFGRCGVQRKASADQMEYGHRVVCALPVLIHTDRIDEYQSLGPMLDQMQLFADSFITDDGCKLFSNVTRDRKLASKFRSLTGAQFCRAEAATVTRQMLGTVSDVEAGKVKFACTQRHK